MSTRAGKRKLEQAAEAVAAGGAGGQASREAGGQASDHSEAPAYDSYYKAVKFMHKCAVDAVYQFDEYRSLLEDEVTMAIGHSQVLEASEVKSSFALAKSMIARVAEASAKLVEQGKAQHSRTPFELFMRLHTQKALTDAARALLNVERMHVEQLRNELAEALNGAKRDEELKLLDTEALLQLRGTLEESLARVADMQSRRAAEMRVCATLPSAVCPITNKCMIDPVMAADGHSYERTAIERWIQKEDQHAKSPLTGVKLSSHAVATNWTLRKTINEAVDAELARQAPGGDWNLRKAIERVGDEIARQAPGGAA